MSHSIERRVAQFFRLRSKAGDRRGWGCLTETEIAAYADHATTGRERNKIEDHLANCEFCLRQVAFLVQIEKVGLPTSVPASLLSRARDLVSSGARVALIPAWARVVAMAACLLLVATVSVRYSHFRSLRSGQKPGASPVGMPSESQSVRGTENARLTVVFPSPESAVARKGLRFQWETVEGALDYEVRILTAEGDVVWEQKTEGSSLELPSDVRLETGHRYYLLIRGDLPEGKAVESAAVPFSVAGQN